MLKFLLLLVVTFLAIRLVFRLLRSGIFLFKSQNSVNPYPKSSPFQREQRVEEADFEVIETQLGESEKRRDVA
jgi:hypothetical protein